jgi:hypothetical protein
MKIWIRISFAVCAWLSPIIWFGAVSGQTKHADNDPNAANASAIPEFASGPYIADSKVVALLDVQDSSGDCARSGILVFACLIQVLDAPENHQAPVGVTANPFNLQVASEIRETIESDLSGFKKSYGISDEQQIHPGFLTHPGSRMELVGIVNRIDRQFINDIVPGSEIPSRCGEISLIYRFSYALEGGSASSRLPVTMNVVVPAIPSNSRLGLASCREVANAWVAEMARSKTRSAAQIVNDLVAPGGVLSGINGRDIERIELNIQAFRISAGSDTTGLGSTAEYVIRVFRWVPERGMFKKSYLTNQIDRARLLGNSLGDENSCDVGVSKPISKESFVSWLLSPVVLSDIDTGTLNIPKEFLACRATTVSPGGQARSGNSLYWDAGNAGANLLDDSQILTALAKARTKERQFSFMRSADDVRLRLNELSCTGCHQSRAVAGFHFPGEDRKNTPSANAVLLAGSPHFYGDQLRRTDILTALADGKKLNRYDLASSYASRPLNSYRRRLATTQLIGGWGGACLTPKYQESSQRKWGCQEGLSCKILFASKNSPSMGSCMPEGRQEIGDALQVGRITTTSYRKDRYIRLEPKGPNHLIPASSLPAQQMQDNSYYGAHQEYYAGRDPTPTETPLEARIVIRDAKTGGFPGGMLRLSECRNLPEEATCGLVASSGFNDCLDMIGSSKTLKNCFEEKTSYAGMRACEVSSPCRDDYICLKPIGFTARNADALHEIRKSIVSYDQDDFGQQKPDNQWLARNNGLGDDRGICIPPYFVFQFRSDKHPRPLRRSMK